MAFDARRFRRYPRGAAAGPRARWLVRERPLCAKRRHAPCPPKSGSHGRTCVVISRRDDVQRRGPWFVLTRDTGVPNDTSGSRRSWASQQRQSHFFDREVSSFGTSESIVDQLAAKKRSQARRGMIALAQPREIEGPAMADDVEKAILFAFDQSDAVAHDLRERAVGYLRDVQVRDRGERPGLHRSRRVSLWRDAETLDRPERGDTRVFMGSTASSATADALVRLRSRHPAFSVHSERARAHAPSRLRHPMCASACLSVFTHGSVN